MGIDISAIAGDIVLWALGGLFAVLVWTRKRIAKWWAPYRDGLRGMGHVPALRLACEQIAPLTESTRRIEVGLLQFNARLGLIEGVTRAQMDRDPTVGTIECDDLGAVNRCNRTLLRWLNATREDVLGWRWLSYVHHADVDALREALSECRREHRECVHRFQWVPSDRPPFAVELRLTPIPDAPPASSWVGYMRQLDGTTDA